MKNESQPENIPTSLGEIRVYELVEAGMVLITRDSQCLVYAAKQGALGDYKISTGADVPAHVQNAVAGAWALRQRAC